jgi:tetratricopeptide (TPR) repeat protein
VAGPAELIPVNRVAAHGGARPRSNRVRELRYSGAGEMGNFIFRFNTLHHDSSPAPRRHLAVAALALCLAAPAAAREPKFATPQAAAQYHVMVGELAALREQPERAATEFLKAAQIVPDAELAMRATSLALSARNESLALKAARRWQALAPDEMDPREAVARLALRAGDRAETLAQCQAIIKHHPGGVHEGFRQVAQVLSQEGGKREHALALMQTLRAAWPGQAGGAHAQALLALRLGELALAEKSAREALALAGRTRDTLLLLAGVLVKTGDIAGADAAIDELVAAGEGPELRMGYARLLLEAERHDEAQRQFERVLAAKPDSAEARYALGLLALEQQRVDAAEPHFRELLKSDELRQRARYYLGRIEEVRKRPAEALKWYEQVTEGEQALDAVTRRAVVLGELGRIEEGRGLMARMRREMPMFGTRFFLAEGEMLLQADAGAEALALYDQALREIPDDPDLLYGRSLVYERLRNVREAEADLRRILARDQDDARAMNALGYMLTVHTERLDEARKLIERALELTPGDAAVIDSLGWVEFRQGRFHAARELLQKAFDKVPDPEIAAHLGEVLWVLGERERALAIWEAALTRDPGHRVLKETMERLAR